MADAIVTVNGRSFRLAAAPGEEARLAEVSAEVTRRLAALLAEHGAVGDDRLLVMAAVSLADELMDRTAERDAALARAEAAEKALPARARKSAAGAG